MGEASIRRKMSEGDKKEDAENYVRTKGDGHTFAQPDVPACSMHPESYLFKGIGLLFICSIGLGNYFCYDAPGAMEEEFEHALGMDETEFGIMYAVYSFPNMVMPIIGGFLIDRVFGIRISISCGAYWVSYKSSNFGSYL